MKLSFFLVMIASPMWHLGQAFAEEVAPDFSKDILPLLAENCFACHGFDAEVMKRVCVWIPAKVQSVRDGQALSWQVMQRLVN